jgi:hypothetical protein
MRSQQNTVPAGSGPLCIRYYLPRLRKTLIHNAPGTRFVHGSPVEVGAITGRNLASRAALRAVATVALPGKNMPQGGCNAPIRNLRGMSVMLDLAAFTRCKTGYRLGEVEEVAREWRNGRRAGFRCQCPKGRGGSNPPSRTHQDPGKSMISRGPFLFSRLYGVSRSVSPRRRC